MAYGPSDVWCRRYPFAPSHGLDMYVLHNHLVVRMVEWSSLPHDGGSRRDNVTGLQVFPTWTEPHPQHDGIFSAREMRIAALQLTCLTVLRLCLNQRRHRSTLSHPSWPASPSASASRCTRHSTTAGSYVLGCVAHRSVPEAFAALPNTRTFVLHALRHEPAAQVWYAW
jgi:hypothetical protein